MNQHLFPALLRITRDLQRLDVSWALAGGLAIAVWVEARTTRDVDLVVAVEREAAVNELVHQLRDLGWKELPNGTIFQRASDRLAVLRLEHRELGSDGVIVDLIFGACGIEREIVDRAVSAEIVPGMSLLVTRPSDLMAMKVLSLNDSRGQDLGDLRALLAKADERQLVETRAALSLMARRLHDVDKDLLAELRRVLELCR